MSSITNAISKGANIHCLLDPCRGNTSQQCRKTIYVFRSGAAIGVDVASKATAVLGVANEENALDGVHGGAGEFGHGVDGGGGALGVSLEDKAHVWVGGEGRLDFVDNLYHRSISKNPSTYHKAREENYIRLQYQEQSSGLRRRGRRCCRRCRRGPEQESSGSWSRNLQRGLAVRRFRGWR